MVCDLTDLGGLVRHRAIETDQASQVMPAKDIVIEQYTK